MIMKAIIRAKQMKQQHAEKALFDCHVEMVDKINKIGDIPQVKIVSADFDNDQIVVTTETLYNKRALGIAPTFKEVMDSVEFLRISNNFAIKHVNFLTGEIVTRWYENEEQKVVFGDLTQEEVNLVKTGQKIQCIKKIRERTGLGLADAKNMMDRADLALSLSRVY